MFKYVRFAHIAVSNQARALAFYRDRLGLHVASDNPYRDGLRWIELSIPGAQTRVLFTKREGQAPEEQPSLVFVTESVKRAFSELAAKGVEFAQPPTDAPWSAGTTHALFRDTEGNMLMLGEDRD
jgi:predicted enzyme related to lactoylglutathione lyase